ncbi:MAG TPA: hypothetical protein PLA83_03490 [Deltaproteobacteria bacterium]|jgi:outer membrane protein assembly factor BamE (lipoprotein component of BamABCDE complex)|nr:hypothetical protein [Deltaproteobacteria bacterium]HQI00948.1 hypothetical protein [Deltaproteobacteria bacterium]HQJ09955.1 hypothetical protein [Deltaproteobacteria bacterium]
MRRFLVAIIMSSLMAAGVLSGCAFGTYGKAHMTYSKMTVPEGLVGRDKSYILKTLGVPDSVARVGDAEYWDYNNKCGYTILLFGKTLQKDLILDIRNDRVTAAYLVDKGSSTGIFSSQG